MTTDTDTVAPPVELVCEDCGTTGDIHTHHANPMCRFELDGFCYCATSDRCADCCPCEHA